MADEVPSLGELLTSLADKIGAPEPSAVSSWMASWVLSPPVLTFLTSSAITSNEKLKQTIPSWKPRYGTLNEGLQQVVEEWKKVGFLNSLQQEE